MILKKGMLVLIRETEGSTELLHSASVNGFMVKDLGRGNVFKILDVDNSPGYMSALLYPIDCGESEEEIFECDTSWVEVNHLVPIAVFEKDTK